jgi:hypothetical protein
MHDETFAHVRVNSFDRPPLWVIAVPVLMIALAYAPGFGGWWLGDDLTNLHHFHHWAEQGRLWSDTWARFFQGISSEGSAYRPLSILSLSANQALAGSHYPGWYAANYLVHLGNTALVALLVLRLAAHAGLSARWAAALAALAFGLAPTLAEGVYWLSARADGWVTLLTLLATWLWAGPGSPTPRTWMPLALAGLLTLGLLFKESAAVYPLQLALLALAWPGRTGAARWTALAIAFALLALFFLWRAHLFGHAFWVYATPNAEQAEVDWLARVTAAIGSAGPWWQALTAGDRLWSWPYFGGLLLALPLAFVGANGAQRRLGLALLCASGGMALATVLNLGTLLAHGEGGRLSYGPIAWAAVALGLLLARPAAARAANAAAALAAVAIVAGALLLLPQLARVRAAQQDLAALNAALPQYVDSHPGYTLLLAPELDGQVAWLRNGQGAIALPPLQREGLLDRVLPTLPRDLAERHARIAGGMLTQFQARRFQHLLGEDVVHLFDPAPARWPANYACWSPRERRIVDLPAPDPADAAAWTAALTAALSDCGIAASAD